MTLTLFVVYSLVGAALLGLIPAAIAQAKGYSFAEWWGYGFLLWIVALPWSLFMGPNPQTRRDCPACRTSVPRDARACPACARDLQAPPPLPPVEVSAPDPEPAPAIELSGAQVGLFFAGVVVLVGVLLVVV